MPKSKLSLVKFSIGDFKSHRPNIINIAPLASAIALFKWLNFVFEVVLLPFEF